MSRSTTFTKGSGVYTCRCCERNTRDDGNGDSVHCRLCTQCFTIGGLENMVQDGQPLSDFDREELAECKKIIIERGGKYKFTILP